MLPCQDPKEPHTFLTHGSTKQVKENFIFTEEKIKPTDQNAWPTSGGLQYGSSEDHIFLPTSNHEIYSNHVLHLVD